MNSRITWEPGSYSVLRGYINGEAKGYKAKIPLFAIDYSSDRKDAQAGTPYLLSHRLPFRGIERKFGSRQEAQKHAERYLLWAMELMGFFPREEGGDA